MSWMLIVMLAWASAPPATVFQVPIATKDLCESAAVQVKADLNAQVAGESVDKPTTIGPGVVTTCIQVSS
jgi:hypothetical protein